ncbi:hypothetical protein TNCV_945791 [Trichonephila clavipes]|nr:hypothetical protein TNCV_945791 [Trichonephila clavipes]
MLDWSNDMLDRSDDMLDGSNDMLDRSNDMLDRSNDIFVDSIGPERLFSINERTLAERSNLPEKRGTESTRLDPPFPIFLYKIETPKLGSKDTLTRDTIRPPTQISKYDSGGPTSVVPKSF